MPVYLTNFLLNSNLFVCLFVFLSFFFSPCCSVSNSTLLLLLLLLILPLQLLSMLLSLKTLHYHYHYYQYFRSSYYCYYCYMCLLLFSILNVAKVIKLTFVLNLQHFSWVFLWPSSLLVARNFTRKGLHTVLRHFASWSALCCVSFQIVLCYIIHSGLELRKK